MADNDPNEPKKPEAPKEPDIWSRPRKRASKEGPPDLDEVMKNFSHKINRLFGKKGGEGDKGSAEKFGFFGLGFIVIIIVLIWALSGIFIVAPAEKAVVLRFGKYTKTLDPGIHWIPRFIASKTLVNVTKVHQFVYSANMLTKDLSIVSIKLAVHYQIGKPEGFLYNAVNPIASLHQATASALRQVVGHTTLVSVLTTGRQTVNDQINEQLKNTLSNYHTGIYLTDVVLQKSLPPTEVTAAFDDAAKAIEDEHTYVRQAEAYAQKVIPIAKGQAARIIQQATATKQQLILQAKAATAPYLALLNQYKKAPVVTRERLYLETMQNVLARSSTVLVDVKGGNNLFSLPLGKLLSGSALTQTTTPSSQSQHTNSTAASPKLTTRSAGTRSYLGYPVSGGGY